MASSELQDFLGIKIYRGHIDYKIVEIFESNEFIRYQIQYHGSENDEIRAFLFIPAQKIIGAILVHHQHNGERHLGKSEVAGISGDRFQFFCPALAKQGIASLAPDSICFEDRRINKTGIEPDESPENDWLQHYNEMSYRILNGSSLMKKVIEDSSIGISVLLQNSGADESNIGILGHSYGGNTVIFHSPFDHRIKYSCSSGAVCSYRTKFENNTGIEMAEVIPNFSPQYDIDDLLKMIAPREILIVAGDSDKYAQDAKQIYLSIRKVNEKAFTFQQFNGGHNLDQKRFDYIINWFVDRFNN